jgi:hypothetical protein
MNVVIDGNSLINVVIGATMHTSQDTDLNRPFFMVNGKWVIKDGANKYYGSAIMRYISNIVYTIGYVDNIYIALDSKSWRKVYYDKYKDTMSWRPDYAEIQKGYKGTRVSDSEKKVQMVELMKHISGNIIGELSKHIGGVKIVSDQGLEGDDIVFLLVDMLKKKGDVLVWSNDSDLHQLIDKNVVVVGGNDSKTNTKKMFRCSPDMVQKPKSGFSLSYSSSDIHTVFDALVKNGTYGEKIVDPHVELLAKVITGDSDSDNIPPCHCILSKTGKIINATRVKVADKVIKSLMDVGQTPASVLGKIDMSDMEMLSEIASLVCEFIGDEGYDDARVADVVNCIKFNYRLVALTRNTVPAPFVEYFDTYELFEGKCFNYYMFVEYMRGNYKY